MVDTQGVQPAQTASLVTGIIGAVLGTAGLVISLLTYLRDRPKLKVLLKWDMTPADRPNEKVGIIRVTNIGRRSAYVAIASLELPKGYKHTNLVINESIPGRQVVEGGAPVGFTVNYHGMETYRNDWKRIRAVVEDSAGKRYYSNYPDRKPSWAE